MTNGTKVKKRNGSIEPLNLEKMHVMVEEACKNLAGVSASQVEIQSGIQFYDGISTAEIQEILIRSASDLIDLDHVNYQYVAARLLLFSLRKQVFGRIHDHPLLIDHVKANVKKRVYDAEILDLYTEEEFSKLQGFIDHDRDYIFTYAGLRQVVDKYLVQDRSSGELYESPQFMYLLISATIFAKYPKETRLDYVKKYYDAISKHKINIPTPIMAGVRTPIRQYASCVLVDIDDTWIAFLVLIWPWVVMLHKGQESVSTQVESVVSMLKSGMGKSNTQVLYLFSRSLKQLSDAALKMALEVDQQLSTSQSGTKKSKIF